MEQSARRTLAAGAVGNALEWYDFAIYGFFASAIGRNFFPDQDPRASLIAAFAAFAAGYLVRPLGGIVLGHIGDRLGRRRLLLISILVMAGPTVAIGLLPTYETWGVVATIAIVLLRLLQGLSIGGEYCGSIVFLVESAPSRHRGFRASWAQVGVVIGILLGSAIGALVNGILEPEAVAAWGWRVPFLFGIVLAITGYVLRRGQLDEAAPADGVFPIVAAVREQWRDMLRMIALAASVGATFYCAYIFAVGWIERSDGVPTTEALMVNMIGMALLLVFTPLAGVLSDRFGRRRTLFAAGAGMVILSYPLVLLMHQREIVWIIVGQFGFGILFATAYCSIIAAMPEIFPRRFRVSAVALSYNVASALFAGTAPMIATWMIGTMRSPVAFAWYIVATAILSLAATVTLRETSREPLG